MKNIRTNNTVATTATTVAPTTGGRPARTMLGYIISNELNG